MPKFNFWFVHVCKKAKTSFMWKFNRVAWCWKFYRVEINFFSSLEQPSLPRMFSSFRFLHHKSVKPSRNFDMNFSLPNGKTPNEIPHQYFTLFDGKTTRDRDVFIRKLKYIFDPVRWYARYFTRECVFKKFFYASFSPLFSCVSPGNFLETTKKWMRFFNDN